MRRGESFSKRIMPPIPRVWMRSLLPFTNNTSPCPSSSPIVKASCHCRAGWKLAGSPSTVSSKWTLENEKEQSRKRKQTSLDEVVVLHLRLRKGGGASQPGTGRMLFGPQEIICGPGFLSYNDVALRASMSLNRDDHFVVS